MTHDVIVALAALGNPRPAARRRARRGGAAPARRRARAARARSAPGSGATSFGSRSSSRRSRPPAACSSPRSPTSSRASSAGGSGSSCIRSRSRRSSRRSSTSTAPPATCSRCRCSAPASPIYHLLVEKGHRRANAGVPRLRAGRVRDEMGRGVRLRHHPDARADSLRAHVRLSPLRAHRRGRGRRYRAGRCRAASRASDSRAAEKPPPVRSGRDRGRHRRACSCSQPA